MIDLIDQKDFVFICAGDDGGTKTITKRGTATKPKPQKPRMYRVIMLNDDYTPMEFVIILIQKIFNKSYDEAVHITFQVHHHGSGVCGVYTREIAETKVAQVIDAARANEHPLLCKMERE